MPALHRLDILAESAGSTITADDIVCDPASGLPIASWSNQATVVNKIDAKYDFNVPGLLPNNFAREQVYTADDSVTRYAAQTPITTEFRGLWTSRGAQAILDRFAFLFMQRWGYPPPILLCSITFRRHLFEFLDTVILTHPLIPNPVTGQLGLDRERFEVLTVSPQFLDAQGNPNGRLDLALVMVGQIETSPIPISPGGIGLSPGDATRDNTDVAVPVGSSATVTTPGPVTTQIRIQLSSLNYYVWGCRNYAYTLQMVEGESVCTNEQLLWAITSWNVSITYHIDYKTAAAPNSAGTGGDPTTGWVTLLGSTTRSNTALYGGPGPCAPEEVPDPTRYISIPPQDYWTHFFDASVLVGEPQTWNVKVFFDTYAVPGTPCPLGTVCSGVGCVDHYEGTSTLLAAKAVLAIDWIEGII